MIKLKMSKRWFFVKNNKKVVKKIKKQRLQAITNKKVALSISLEHIFKLLHLKFYRKEAIFSAHLKYTGKILE